MFFLNTTYLQDILGWSALETGLGFLPVVLVIGVAANVATKLIPRIVPGFVVLGFGVGLVFPAASIPAHPGSRLTIGGTSAEDTNRLPGTPCRVSRLLRVGSNT